MCKRSSKHILHNVKKNETCLGFGFRIRKENVTMTMKTKLKEWKNSRNWKNLVLSISYFFYFCILLTTFLFCLRVAFLRDQLTADNMPLLLRTWFWIALSSRTLCKAWGEEAETNWTTNGWTPVTKKKKKRYITQKKK